MSLSVRLTHRLGDFALDVSFEAPSGVTMLYGRSGSGKTTIVNALAGLIRPEAGRISVGDMPLYDSKAGINLPVHKRQIGYIFQEGRLFPHLTVQQNLKYGEWFANRREARADWSKIVDMLGIGALLKRRPEGLSGGEKQRVAIGRALLARPRLLLADEPLAALDEARKEEILPYFERLCDELDVPILYVSHASAEVTRLADTLVVLENGRLLRAGPAREVLSDPGITPLGAGAAGVLLEAHVTAEHEDGVTEVTAGGLPLLLPQVRAAVGADLRLRIEAQDVMIALTRPEDISALNVLPATVATLRLGDGPGALVQLRAGENLLLARITRRSVDALKLCEGKPVFAVLKAVSIPRGAIGDTPKR
ncbi:MAG: molybdenum ABC transporter ATP-binding protein [Pseudomonadota bacterium]